MFLIGYGIDVVVKKNQNNDNSNNSTASASINEIKPVDNNDHVLGDPNAPITLIEYSDYQCPYCIKHYPVMKDIVEKNAGKVKWVYRNLIVHPSSEKNSEAAEAAGAQGKFWEYSDLLMQNAVTNGGEVSETDLINYAKQLNLNTDQFKSDLDSGKYASRIQSDVKSAEDAGIDSTPTTILIDKNGNKKAISGAVKESEIQSLIDAAK